MYEEINKENLKVQLLNLIPLYEEKYITKKNDATNYTTYINYNLANFAILNHLYKNTNINKYICFGTGNTLKQIIPSYIINDINDNNQYYDIFIFESCDDFFGCPDSKIIHEYIEPKLADKIKNIQIYHIKTYIEKFLQWMFDKKNIQYIGCIFYSNVKLNAHPIYIFKKTIKIPKLLYNPKPCIEKIKMFDKQINVVRDDYIVGGTKTRAAIKLFKKVFKNKLIDTLIYFGAPNGYAQICIAYSLFLMKKKDIKLVLISHNFNLDDIKLLHKLVLFYHPNTEFIIKDAPKQELWDIYDSYNHPNEYLVPFGFKFEQYENILFKNLSKYLESYKSKIKRMWLVIGSGTILHTLQRILVDTQFLGVQVGRTIKDDEIYDKKRLVIYVSPYKLSETGIEYNYYNTLSSYDGKVLEFVEKYGLDGDYIWNVAGIHKYI